MKSKRIIAVVAAAAAVVALAVAFVAPVGASAQTKQKVTMTVQAKLQGTSVSGKVSGTLGSGTQTGKNVSETDVRLTWHLSGGTISVSASGHLAGGTKTTGTWKVTGGTGKYKGATGGGSQTGNIKTLEFVYKGTINY